MPYKSSGPRRSNVQIGVGRSVWGGRPPSPIPERVLDSVPGCIFWLVILFSVVAAIVAPRMIFLLATLATVFSAFQLVMAVIANHKGNRHIACWETIDWRAKFLEMANEPVISCDSVHHIVLIPNYEEPEPLLYETIESLASSPEAENQMTVVLAMEASEDGCVPKAEGMQSHFSPHFANFYFTVHPSGLPGEIQSKSANLAWAIRWIKRKLVDEKGYNLDNIVVTVMDADTRWHQNYFSALTYHFARDNERHHRFWQAPIRYHGKIWSLNPLLQLIYVYSTAFELAYLTASLWQPLPISSYSMSLRLLEVSEYWDTDVIADDWHMYIKAYFANDSRLKLVPLFLPFRAYVIPGETSLRAGLNRYLQTVRHALGSKEFGYLIAKILENPAIPLRPSLRLMLRVSHDTLLTGVGWILIVLGTILPLALHSQFRAEFASDAWQSPVYIALQVSVFVIFTVGIVVWYQDVRIRPVRKQRIPILYLLLTLLSVLLLPFLALIFLVLPLLHAQTRLLLGATLEFRVSRKL